MSRDYSEEKKEVKTEVFTSRGGVLRDKSAFCTAVCPAKPDYSLTCVLRDRNASGDLQTVGSSLQRF
jgi:hypothetical protein